MNPAQFLSHFDRISEAPDAIPRLRHFILDLAVRGKLVEQDPSDEPASELVKHIQAEEARMRKEGRNRKQEQLSPAVAGAMPFPAPKHWSWLPLTGIGLLSGGMTPSKNRQDYWEGDINWFSPKDIKSDELVESELKITSTGAEETGLQLYPPGCLFIVARSGILKRTFPVSINRVEATANQDLKVLKPFIKGLERYLQIMFRGMTDVILSTLVKTGTTVQSLKYAEFEFQPFPLPPLAEQHRIVAKVDELMALCDCLEAAQTERENRRDRLVASSLNRLNNGADPDAFREHARFYFNQLPRLTTRPEHIKQLRQTILNLAVRGKLVPQDPSDEPASELYKHIQAEQAQQKTEGLYRSSKSLPPIGEDEMPFPLPFGWEWFRLRSLVFTLGDGLHGTPEYSEGTNFHFINGNNLVDGRIVIKPHTKTVSFDEMQKHRKLMTSNTVLVSINGTLGNIAFYNNEDIVLGKSACYFNLSELLDKHFIRLVLESPYFVTYAVENATGTTILNLGLKAMNFFPVPLPPHAEQQRIVEKVDELMALCDQLEAQLATTRTESRHLLDSLLHHALTKAT